MLRFSRHPPWMNQVTTTLLQECDLVATIPKARQHLLGLRGVEGIGTYDLLGNFIMVASRTYTHERCFKSEGSFQTPPALKGVFGRRL